MRAWLYYRLSRDEDEEMNSLQNQRQILVDYAEQNGYEIVGESFDDNVSGMTFNRKGLGELEIAVDEGKIDVVLVKDSIKTWQTPYSNGTVHRSLATEQCQGLFCD